MQQELNKVIERFLNDLDIQNPAVVFEHPADFKNGDLSTNIAMVYAKQLNMKPRELAERVASELEKNKLSQIEKIEVAGAGFINFYFSKQYFAEAVAKILKQGEKWGINDLYKNQTWAVEYASPNPNKAMHLGHLRNVITGVSLCRILEANGAVVIREMVDNDRGIAIAKLMWGYLVGAKKDGRRIEDISYWESHQNEWLLPEEKSTSPDKFVDELYVLGATEYENPETEIKIRELVVKWEANDKLVRELWKKVLSYAHEGQLKTLIRLGATFDFIWHEHEHYEVGKKFVEEGLQEHVFKRLDDGAIITDLEKYKLTDTVVEKKDGTALYITQDIALTDLKKKAHHADKLVWIIGPEQSLAMQQLFAVCEQLGICKREEFLHVSYGYVSLRGSGKMSSRAGNVVYLDDVIDEAKEKVKTIMCGRIPENKLDGIAEEIAHAAIAFGILKAGRTTDLAFDMEQALKLEGDTGPYLEYATVRANAVLEKAEREDFVPSATIDSNWETANLEKLLVQFPCVVRKAGIELAPSTIATYLIELASTFNHFYATEKIIDMDDKYSPYKLMLTKAFSMTMWNGLHLLGIAVPEKM